MQPKIAICSSEHPVEWTDRSYQIVNLMVPTTGHKYDFSCFLNDLQGLTGLVVVRKQPFVLKLGCSDIIS